MLNVMPQLVAARLYQAFKFPPEVGGKTLGHENATLDLALELAWMFRKLIVVIDGGMRVHMKDAGGEFELSNGAFTMLKEAWGKLRAVLGIGAAEDIKLVEDFLAGCTDKEESDGNDG